MCNWTTEQQEIISAAKAGTLPSLGLPKRYKCSVCYHVLAPEAVEITLGNRPICKTCHSPVVEMCPLDHIHCSHSVESGLAYCPVCGRAICPICGSHDVTQISRVTGYLADVDGWNAAKAQELKDRQRSNIIGSDPVLVPNTHRIAVSQRSE